VSTRPQDPADGGAAPDERDFPEMREGGGPDPDELPPELDQPRLFQHQPWMVGVVLVFAVAAVVAGVSNPVWWRIGSPLILVLVLYLGVRFTSRK